MAPRGAVAVLLESGGVAALALGSCLMVTCRFIVRVEQSLVVLLARMEVISRRKAGGRYACLNLDWDIRNGPGPSEVVGTMAALRGR